jgi:uncharacterized protein
MNKVYVTWDEITKYCVKSVDLINDWFPKPTVIVAVARGGLVPATIISNILDVGKIFCCGYKRYTKDDKEGETDIYQLLTHPFDKTDNVLIVDDICDKGHTLKFILSDIKLANPLIPPNHIHTCTLFYKDNDLFKPNIYATKTETSNWIVFPWEWTKI